MIELSVSLASNGVVKVPGYERMVRFGYTKNRGVYRLHVDAIGEWEGLCRKGVSLLVVLVACRLDAIIGSSFIRDTTVIAFVCNETISIIENAGLMGVPIPAALTKAVDVLRQRAEKNEE